MKSIPVIDLFAGPGGLGEGFSSFTTGRRPSAPFQIALSIEKDPFAHRTLELRSFCRKFAGKVPAKYEDYVLCCEVPSSSAKVTREELFNAYPEEAKGAQREAWNAELGGTDFPDSLIDRRIENALQGASEWVLIGGPPCQAYSLVGRSRMRGANPEKYESDHRHFLYKQYLRILAKHQPPVFVMENVKGILSSQVGGEKIFSRILDDLKQPGRSIDSQGARKSEGYSLFSLVEHGSDPSSRASAKLWEEPNPHRFVVRCEEYGIPQARHRVIILGIRNNVAQALRNGSPRKLTRQPRITTLRDQIERLPKLRSRISRGGDSPKDWENAVRGVVSDRILDEIGLDELRHTIRKFAHRVDGTLPVQRTHTEQGIRIYNHATKGHMESDLLRYFYAACFAEFHPDRRSPMLAEFPNTLLPNHKNVVEGVEGDKFGDRFRVQVWDRPATTITSHLSKDGHYFIHPDPLQCRSLTVREAACLQTFPDDYFFEGPRTSQYLQVGNAVPPALARQIAEIVYDILV